MLSRDSGAHPFHSRRARIVTRPKWTDSTSLSVSHFDATSIEPVHCRHYIRRGEGFPSHQLGGLERLRVVFDVRSTRVIVPWLVL